MYGMYWARIARAHVHGHNTPWLSVEQQIKRRNNFKSLAWRHRGKQAALRSNRLTQFLWLWWPFRAGRWQQEEGKKENERL